jgi:hypothetical protein
VDALLETVFEKEVDEITSFDIELFWMLGHCVLCYLLGTFTIHACPGIFNL